MLRELLKLICFQFFERKSEEMKAKKTIHEARV